LANAKIPKSQAAQTVLILREIPNSGYTWPTGLLCSYSPGVAVTTVSAWPL